MWYKIRVCLWRVFLHSRKTKLTNHAAKKYITELSSLTSQKFFKFPWSFQSNSEMINPSVGSSWAVISCSAVGNNACCCVGLTQVLIRTAECLSINLCSLPRYLNAVHSLETHLRSRIAIRDLVFDVTTISIDMWRQCGFTPSTQVLPCQLSLQQRRIFLVSHSLSTVRSVDQWSLTL
jgi:hypothetical protein